MRHDFGGFQDFGGFDFDALEARASRRCCFGGGSSTNTIQSSDPWSGEQPSLTNLFQGAGNLYGTGGPQYYPGQPIAPLTGSQTQAINDLFFRGLVGTPGMQAAQRALPNIVSGDSNAPASDNYSTVNLGIANTINGAGAAGQNQLEQTLSGNYLQPDSKSVSQLTDSIRANVLPGLESQFGASGNMNNPSAAFAASQGLTSALAQPLFQNYQQERNNQLQAAGMAGVEQQGAEQLGSQNYLQGQGQQLIGAQMAPSLFNAELGGQQTALQAATLPQQQQQQDINAGIQQWNYNQMLPWTNLGLYQGAISGNYGGTTHLQQPYFPNTAQNIMAGGLGVAGLTGPQGLGLWGGAAGAGAGAGASAAGLTSSVDTAALLSAMAGGTAAGVGAFGGMDGAGALVMGGLF